MNIPGVMKHYESTICFSSALIIACPELLNDVEFSIKNISFVGKLSFDLIYSLL